MANTRHFAPGRRRQLVSCLWAAIAVIGVPISVVSSAPQAPPLAASSTDDYRIGSEDVLDVVVWRNPDLVKTVQVRPDGKISLPLVNDVRAVDLTPMELRDVLIKQFSGFLNDPEVAVIVREIHSFKISVIGRVKTPGRFDLRSGTTLLDVLALAGGFVDFAKRDRILVKRRDGTTLTFDYDKFIEHPAGRTDLALQPNDVVIVP